MQAYRARDYRVALEYDMALNLSRFVIVEWEYEKLDQFV